MPKPLNVRSTRSRVLFFTFALQTLSAVALADGRTEIGRCTSLFQAVRLEELVPGPSSFIPRGFRDHGFANFAGRTTIINRIRAKLPAGEHTVKIHGGEPEPMRVTYPSPDKILIRFGRNLNLSPDPQPLSLSDVTGSEGSITGLHAVLAGLPEGLSYINSSFHGRIDSPEGLVRRDTRLTFSFTRMGEMVMTLQTGERIKKATGESETILAPALVEIQPRS